MGLSVETASGWTFYVSLCLNQTVVDPRLVIER